MDSYFFRKAGNHVLDYSCSMSIVTRDLAHVLAPYVDSCSLNSHCCRDSLVYDERFIWRLQSRKSTCSSWSVKLASMARNW